MIAEKPSPGLRRWTRVAQHVLRDRGLGYANAQPQRFSVDSRCPPQWIWLAHLLDYLSRLSVDLRPADSQTALPSPLKPKAFASPSHGGFGLHNDKTRAPIGPCSPPLVTGEGRTADQYAPYSRPACANASTLAYGTPSRKKSVVERIQLPLGFTLSSSSFTLARTSSGLAFTRNSI